MKFIKKLKLVVILPIFILAYSCCCNEQVNQNCSTIIAHGSIAKEKDFSDFFVIDRIIKLDSKKGFFLGHSKFYVGQKYIVVKNGLQNQDVLIFDKENGLAVSKFNRFGKGPDEYFFIQSLNILKNDSIIEIGTSNKKQIIQYDKDGNVIKSKRIPLRYWCDVDYLNDSTFCLYMSGGFSKEKMFKYATYNLNNKELNFNLKIDKHEDYMFYTGLDNFQRSNDTLFLTEPISNLIYSISEEGLTERYYIDYGDNAIPPSFLNKKYRDILEFHKKLGLKSYAYHQGKIHITNGHIIIESYKGNDKYMVVYCKSSGKSRIIESFNTKLPLSDVKRKFVPKIAFCDGEFIYISIDPEEIAKWYSIKLPKIGGFEAIATDFSNFKSSISKSTAYDNPFLLKCRLKIFD
ncbi:MAG: 6-bladed beta-propeller [Clostridiales bacterium]|nr:6-bladed beta-propeller [Clostridiales bacterium]